MLICLVTALFYAFFNGFHDAPIILAHMVSSRSIGSRAALIYTGLLEFIGAACLYKFVLKTMSFQTLANTFSVFSEEANIIRFVMITLLVALSFNIATWYLGLPSSSTHALFGAMSGAALGFDKLGGMIFERLLPLFGILFLSTLLGFLLSLALTKLIYSMDIPYPIGSRVTKLGNIAMGGLFALFHGANDAPKSFGLFLFAALSAGWISGQYGFFAILFAGAISIGVLFGENRILKTIGLKLFKIEAAQAFGAGSSSASLLAISTLAGFPVSSTQILTGGILGAGAAKNVSSVRWMIAGEIIISWIVTLPACMILAYAITKFI